MIITPVLKLGEERGQAACQGPGGESVAVLPSPTRSSQFPAQPGNRSGMAASLPRDESELISQAL